MFIDGAAIEEGKKNKDVSFGLFLSRINQHEDNQHPSIPTLNVIFGFMVSSVPLVLLVLLYKDV